MNGILVKTTLNGKNSLKNIIKSGIIGINSKPIGSQFPQFAEIPLVYASYFCEGYPDIYGNREGIVFETDASEIYACPTDSFQFMRAGNWLPGHERFIFPSIKEMLKKYPTSEDFRQDFRKYFMELTPQQVFPGKDVRTMQFFYEMDDCFSNDWDPGCNEVTFMKPLQVKNCKIFDSREELEKMMR